MNKRIALIDGDVYTYRAAAACQTVIEWEPGQFTGSADIAKAKDHFKTAIKRTVEHLKADPSATIIAMSPKEGRYWRHDIYPAYKSNRLQASPVVLTALRDWVRGLKYSLTIDTLEGDDVLGIEASRPNPEGHTRIVCSPDKDMAQLPCDLYNPVTQTYLPHLEGCRGWLFHMIQTLTGDRVDGYPGCPGMGPQRAAKLLLDAKTPAEAWERVLKAYEKAGQTAEVALVQARIAKILLHNDWDGKTVRLWSIDNESV